MSTQSTELAAYALTMRALKRIEIRNHMGRASQELALRLIGQRDSALAKALHPQAGDSGHAPRSYTTSGLLWDRTTQPVIGSVPRDGRVWLRITTFSPAVVEALDASFATLPATIEYDNHPWAVEAIAADSHVHPWAGRAQYAMLEAPKESPRLTLEFATPTGFRSKGLDVPLPLPWLVFHSLAEHWPTHLPLPEGLLNFVEQFLALTRYQLQTAMLGGKAGGKRVGFVGQATFMVVADNAGLAEYDLALYNYLHHHREAMTTALTTLARFAFFAGVGRQTTSGMGMCCLRAE